MLVVDKKLNSDWFIHSFNDCIKIHNARPIIRDITVDGGGGGGRNGRNGNWNWIAINIIVNAYRYIPQGIINGSLIQYSIGRAYCTLQQ